MANLYRLRVSWTGVGVVGPSVSTFYSSTAATGLPAALVTFFNTLKNFWTADVTWTVPNTGDLLEDSTGQLLGGWTAGTGGTVTGAATGHNFILGAGARIVWSTNGVVAGHRVHGSTFLTSMNAIEFQTDGTPQSSTVGTIGTACSTLIGGVPTLVVWSRPVVHKPKTTPPTYDRLGTQTPITGGALHDAASWLRSRRT